MREIILTPKDVKFWMDLSKQTLGNMVCKLDLDGCIRLANKCENYLLFNDQILVMMKWTGEWRLCEVIFNPYIQNEVLDPLVDFLSFHEKPIRCIVECPRHDVIIDAAKYFDTQYISDKEFIIK